MNTKTQKREARKRRIRSRVSGTIDRPRLAIFKSNSRIIAQAIDDVTGKTIAYISSDKVKGITPKERAILSGKAIAEQIIKQGISTIVFDRGGFLYSSTIKAFADSARESGLKF